MGSIYLITNLINDKKYVGLTTRSIDIRWKEHCRHSSQRIDEAIQQYGKDNFTIEKIEDCLDELLDEREKYWIEYYNSYENGYNNTPGGRDLIEVYYPKKLDKTRELWNKGLGQKKISDELGINIETVHNYLLKLGISSEEIRDRQKQQISNIKGKAILQYTEDGVFVKEWKSQIELYSTGLISRSSLQRCLKDPNKIFKGYKYIYKGE